MINLIIKTHQVFVELLLPEYRTLNLQTLVFVSFDQNAWKAYNNVISDRVYRLPSIRITSSNEFHSSIN